MDQRRASETTGRDTYNSPFVAMYECTFMSILRVCRVRKPDCTHGHCLTRGKICELRLFELTRARYSPVEGPPNSDCEESRLTDML